MEEKEKLKIMLIQYRDYTLELITSLEKDFYDNIEEFIQKRQLILDSLDNIQCSKEDINKIVKELNLQQISDKLMKLMECKLDIIQEGIKKLSKTKVATNLYNKNLYNGVKIFSKKI